MKVKVKKLKPEAVIPDYSHPGDAGLNLYCLEDKVLGPGQRHLFDTGIALEVPGGHVCLIWGRSGLAIKGGLHHLGGVVDAGYRGEVRVNLVILGTEAYAFKKGDKIAQLLIQPIASVEIEEAEELSDSARAEGSFGSTGR